MRVRYASKMLEVDETDRGSRCASALASPIDSFRTSFDRRAGRGSAGPAIDDEDMVEAMIPVWSLFTLFPFPMLPSGASAMCIAEANVGISLHVVLKSPVIGSVLPGGVKSDRVSSASGYRESGRPATATGCRAALPDVASSSWRGVVSRPDLGRPSAAGDSRRYTRKGLPPRAMCPRSVSDMSVLAEWYGKGAEGVRALCGEVAEDVAVCVLLAVVFDTTVYGLLIEGELEVADANGLRNAESDLKREGRGGEGSAEGLTKMPGTMLRC